MLPFSIPRSVTSRVGEAFIFRDRFGQVSEGHRTDLVLFESNPFSDIGNVNKRGGVMVATIGHPSHELQAGLARIEA